MIATGIMTYVVYACLAFLVTTIVYLIAVLMFAKSDLREFYVTLPVNRFAFIIKGGEIVRVIYNSKDAKLIKQDGYPLGKFVLKSELGLELQELGPVERMLGIRFVGIPFVHSVMEKKLSWIGVEGVKFTTHENEKVWNFAITHTFGFNLQELTLGGDSDNGMNDQSEENSKTQKLQRILVDVQMILQGWIVNPHLAIITTDWMAGVEGKLKRSVQNYLGRTSQDELINQKSAKGQQCELVREIVDNIGELQVYGVTFEQEKITYVDYKLSGGPENAAAIQKANNEKYVGQQEANKIRSKKIAEQADSREQVEIFMKMNAELLAKGYSQSDAKEMVQSFMKTTAMVKTGIGTWVEGGATGITTAIQAGGGKKSKTKNSEAEVTAPVSDGKKGGKK